MKYSYFKNLNIINICILEFSFFQINESNTIKFQIKTLKFLEINKNNNELDKERYFYYDLILNNIYSSIKIGTPPKKIIGFYSGKINEFSIIHDKCFLNHSKYNRTQSKSFINLTSFIISHRDYKNGCFAQENFEFEQYIEDMKKGDKNNTIFFNKIKFFLPDDYPNSKNNKNIKNINTCGIIGLQLNNKDLFKETPKNFIYYLMQYFLDINRTKINDNDNKMLLNNYYWTFKYNKDNNNYGYFSIGDPPHIYEPENYKNKQFKEFNIEFGYSSLYWNIQFAEIYINKNDNNNNKFNTDKIYLKKYFDGNKCLFYPEINVIFGTIQFFNLIKKEFFNKYFINNICFERKVYISNNNSTIIEGFGGEYTIISCKANKIDKEKFYLEFPSLNFYHQLINYTFIFNGNELFIEDQNKNIYFLICTKKNAVDQWIFGKVFMKKYQIIFNNEMKTIGFYIERNNYNVNIINSSNHIKVIIIIILSFLIILLFIILIKIYKKSIGAKKKIYIKELEMINEDSKLL